MRVRLRPPERPARSGVVDTVRFMCAHPAPVAGVCMLAAAARFAQAGWAESLPPGGSLALELVVAVARLALVLIAVGGGDLRQGIQAVRAFVAQPESDRAAWFVRLVEQPEVRGGGFWSTG